MERCIEECQLSSAQSTSYSYVNSEFEKSLKPSIAALNCVCSYRAWCAFISRISCERFIVAHGIIMQE